MKKLPAAPANERSRTVRIGAQLRQEMARLTAGMADPRLANLVITSAWISADLSLAKIFFRIVTTAVGTELDALRKDADAAFVKANGRLRKAVTARLKLRIAPELRFLYDEGQDARDRIESILDEIRRG